MVAIKINMNVLLPPMNKSSHSESFVLGDACIILGLTRYASMLNINKEM